MDSLSGSNLLLRRVLALSSMAAALATLTTPQVADACGGTFCDAAPPPTPQEPNPPTPMPVDQVGETIIFVMDGTTVETHIQIEYDPNTDASEFAWLIPVQSLPEFSVGSQALFVNAQLATVPTFGYSTDVETSCGGGTTGFGGGGIGQPWDGGGGGGCGCGSKDASESSGDTGFGGGETGGDTGGEGGGVNDPGGEDGQPNVLERAIVGAFEVVVLQGNDVMEITTWLETNGYQTDPDADPIIADYIAEGHLFVAMKLATGEDASAVHPITLTFADGEPCIPLRLTSIAARDDMAIRVIAIGDSPAAPLNWPSVVPNDLRFDWMNVGSNYLDVVTMAVDEAPANGRAWVTEFQGQSIVVDRDELYSVQWVSSVFETIDPIDIVDELTTQGLWSCVGPECSGTHPLIDGLVATYLPPPAGVTGDEFWNCLSCYEAEIDLMVWDGPTFAADLEARVIEPGQHALAVLQDHPSITRMFTTISPHEMVEDPTFHLVETRPTVDRDHRGTWDGYCSGAATFETEEGEVIVLPNESSYPTVIADMPYSRRVEMIPASGPPVQLQNNDEDIASALGAWNDLNGGLPDGAPLPYVEPGTKTGFVDLGAGAGGLGLLGLLALRRRRRT